MVSKDTLTGLEKNLCYCVKMGESERIAIFGMAIFLLIILTLFINIVECYDVKIVVKFYVA